MAGGRIQARGQDKGAGFAVSPSVVVTANHVVRDQDSASLAYVTEGGDVVAIERVERAEELDVALLYLSKEVPEVVRVGLATEGLSWRVELSPRPNDAWLSGTVTAVRRHYRNSQGRETYVTQLHVEEELEEYAGYSGSPVMLATEPAVAVAVLVEELRVRLPRQLGDRAPASNVLYATPLADVIQRFRLELQVVRADEAPKKRAPNIVAPHEVPLAVGDFTGRKSELAALRAAIEDEHYNAIGIFGEGGLGKTELGKRFISEIVEQYADGQIYLDLKSASDSPMTAQAALSYAIEKLVPGSVLPADTGELSKLWRSRLFDKRVILFMDNAAASDQIAEQVPPPPSCLLLVTSRHQLVIPGMFALRPESLASSDAVDLLLRIESRIGPLAATIAGLSSFYRTRFA